MRRWQDMEAAERSDGQRDDRGAPSVGCMVVVGALVTLAALIWGFL